MIRVGNGDEAAFMALYDRHAGALFGTAVRFLRDRESAAEVVQDVFVAIWQRAAQYDPRSGTAIGWFIGIARNRSIDRLRAEARRPSPVYARAADPDAAQAVDPLEWADRQLGGTAEGNPAIELNRRWTRALVRTTLAEMPPDERQVVVLAYDQGLRQSEIAERLGLPIGTVKSRTRRALARLRARLADVPDLRERHRRPRHHGAGPVGGISTAPERRPMTALGHAEAHERLADLALEPEALDRLGRPATDPLSAHVATCGTCDREVRAWRETHADVAAARSSGADPAELGNLSTDVAIAPPAGLRDAVLRAVRDLPGADRRQVHVVRTVDDPRPASVEPRRRLDRSRLLLPLVAVVGIVALGAGLLVDQASRLDRTRQETAALEGLTATLDRVLRDPAHRVVDLRGADGTVSGSLSWSRHDIAVVTLALGPPPPDRVYRCWIERDGVRSPMGEMWFAGGTSFWNGSLDEWATTSFEAGGTFGVSLEPVAGPVGNPAVLAADLGS